MEEFIAGWTARQGASRDQLMPLLHAIQEEAGHVADEWVPVIARALNIT